MFVLRSKFIAVRRESALPIFNIQSVILTLEGSDRRVDPSIRPEEQ